MSKKGNLRYSGDGDKTEAIAWVNAALEKNSKVLRAESLLGSLADYTRDMNVNVMESDDCYRIILDPVSGEGHDFDIQIDKKTCFITGMIVGSIEPDPEGTEK